MQSTQVPPIVIITAPSAAGGYFAEDLRSIREEGVEHVMRVFFRHICATHGGSQPVPEPAPREFLSKMHEVVDALCEESGLDVPPSE